jgi:putative flippase GtrA
MSVGAPSRFALVGLVCAAAHNAILLAADWCGIHYAPACVVSYPLVVGLGFVLHVRFTFEQPATFAAFWRYGASMAANYPITLALLFLMCDVGQWPVAVGSPAATVLLFVWNYVAGRWAIIRKPPPPASMPEPARPA